MIPQRCPYCGGKVAIVNAVSEDAQGRELNGQQVTCDACGASGPISKTRREGVKKWNSVSA